MLIRDIQLETISATCLYRDGSTTFIKRIPLKWLLNQWELEHLEVKIQHGLEALIMQFPECVEQFDGSTRIDNG